MKIVIHWVLIATCVVLSHAGKIPPREPPEPQRTSQVSFSVTTAQSDDNQTDTSLKLIEPQDEEVSMMEIYTTMVVALAIAALIYSVFLNILSAHKKVQRDIELGNRLKYERAVDVMQRRMFELV